MSTGSSGSCKASKGLGTGLFYENVGSKDRDVVTVCLVCSGVVVRQCSTGSKLQSERVGDMNVVSGPWLDETVRVAWFRIGMIQENNASN